MAIPSIRERVRKFNEAFIQTERLLHGLCPLCANPLIDVGVHPDKTTKRVLCCSTVDCGFVSFIPNDQPGA